MNDKLQKAKEWFEQVTEADSNLIGLMGITPTELIEMYEVEVEGKVLPKAIESNEIA